MKILQTYNYSTNDAFTAINWVKMTKYGLSRETRINMAANAMIAGMSINDISSADNQPVRRYLRHRTCLRRRNVGYL